MMLAAGADVVVDHDLRQKPDLIKVRFNDSIAGMAID